MGRHSKMIYCHNNASKGHVMICKPFSSIVVLFILLLPLFGCSSDGRNSEISKVDSPDGQYYAVVFVRDEGATTDFSTQVSILRKGSILGGARGNVFTCDSDHGKAISLENHSYWLKATWTSPRELVIQYDQRVRVFKKNEKIMSIKVRYDPVEAQSAK